MKTINNPKKKRGFLGIVEKLKQKKGGKNKIMNSKIRRYELNERRIDLLCCQFSLNKYYTDEVKRLYYKALHQELTQGCKIELTIGAIIYFIHKRDDSLIKMKIISEKLQEKKKLLFKRYNLLRREMRLRL